jgi:hypothetical protein
VFLWDGQRVRAFPVARKGKHHVRENARWKNGVNYLAPLLAPLDGGVAAPFPPHVSAVSVARSYSTSAVFLVQSGAICRVCDASSMALILAPLVTTVVTSRGRQSPSLSLGFGDDVW